MGLPNELPFLNSEHIRFEKRNDNVNNLIVYRRAYCASFGSRTVKKEVSKTITRKRTEVPLWEKATLTLEEAAEFSGIGIHKIRELTDAKNCKFILWNGNRRLIKRKKFEEFIDESFSI